MVKDPFRLVSNQCAGCGRDTTSRRVSFGHQGPFCDAECRRLWGAKCGRAIEGSEPCAYPTGHEGDCSPVWP